jgi:hypothetical protein
VHAPAWGMHSSKLYSGPPEGITVEFFSDGTFSQVHQSKADCNLAWLGEPPSIDAAMYQAFLADGGTHSLPFEKIYTFNKELLDRGGKFTRVLEASSWVYQNNER